VAETAGTAHARNPRADPRGSDPGVISRNAGGTGDGGRGPRVGVQLQLLEARNPTEIDQAFAAATREGAGALMVFGDGGSFFPYRAKIADLAVKHRLPSIFGGRAFVEAGGLMSYGASPPNQGQRTAAYVDKILKGAKPADLPIELPTKFELVINLKTAQVSGLTIPPMLLFQADEVIQ
jgi:putative ABC transport system substrate-binding protein